RVMFSKTPDGLVDTIFLGADPGGNADTRGVFDILPESASLGDVFTALGIPDLAGEKRLVKMNHVYASLGAHFVVYAFTNQGESATSASPVTSLTLYNESNCPSARFSLRFLAWHGLVSGERYNQMGKQDIPMRKPPSVIPLVPCRA